MNVIQSTIVEVLTTPTVEGAAPVVVKTFQTEHGERKVALRLVGKEIYAAVSEKRNGVTHTMSGQGNPLLMERFITLQLAQKEVG